MKAKEQDEIKRWERKFCRESKSPEAMATSLCGYGYYDPNGVPKEAIVKYLAMGAEWQREHVWHDPDEVPEVDAKIMWEDENCLGKHLAEKWVPKRDVFGRKQRWCYVGDIAPRYKRKED